MKNIKFIAALSMTASLVACGGGGDDETTTSSLSFNLESAYKTLVATGEPLQQFNVSLASCTGTATYSSSPANTSTTFEGTAAVSSTSTLSVSISPSSNCNATNVSETEIDYYSTTYLPLGIVVPGSSYMVFNGGFSIPFSVKVGDQGVLGSLNSYTDSTKSTANGSAQVSYEVTSDTSSTAMVTVITKAYDASNVLQSTQRTKYKIDAASRLTIQSITIRDTATGLDMVLTPQP